MIFPSTTNAIDFDNARLQRHGFAPQHSHVRPALDYEQLRRQLDLQLQTSLEADKILSMLFQSVQQLIPLNALSYKHLPTDLRLELGERGRHKATYSMTHEGEQMGELSFQRDHRFAEHELLQLDHGHATGDEVLRAVTHAVKDCLRNIDQVFRFGGEEFLVVLSNTGRESAALVGERLRSAALRLAYPVKGRPVELTVSLGCSTLLPGESSDSMLRACRDAVFAHRTVGLLRTLRGHAPLEEQVHVLVAFAHGHSQLALQLLAGVIARQRADDFQRFPRVRVIVLGVHLQPFHRTLSVLRREHVSIGVLSTDHCGPFARGTFDGVVGSGDRYHQRIGRTAVPTPVAQCMQFRRHALRLQVFQSDAVGGAPVDPVIGMVEFDADVAHQPSSRHVFARVSGESGFGQVMRHIDRELFDHRPATNQVLAHGFRTEPPITHALIKFMPYHLGLGVTAIFNQLLCPSGVTAGIHQRTGSNEHIDHCVAPLYEVAHGMYSAKSPGSAEQQWGLPRWPAFDELGDRLFAHYVPDMVDHFYHRPVDRVVEHVFYETAINLQEVHRQVLQVGDRTGFGDFETDKFRRYCVDLELLAQVFQKSVIANAAAGQVDGAHSHQPCVVFGLEAVGDDHENVLDDPAIQSGHHAVALGGGNETAKAVVLQSHVQALDPGHFAKAGRQIGVVVVVDLNPKDAKLVAAQASERIALAHALLQQRADVSQQFIPGGMTAGVVDQLELVQIEEHQRVLRRLRALAIECELQAVFEFAAVGQPGESVVGRLPGQVGDVLTLLRHVMQHQHRTA
nr:hypothetical protein [Tanacetum cinerariifolium]